MSFKTVGAIVAVVGALGALFFALANVIGVGANPDMFGCRQLGLTVLSVQVFIIGLIIYRFQMQSRI